jgi:hypothetical protein
VWSLIVEVMGQFGSVSVCNSLNDDHPGLLCGRDGGW